MASIHERQGKRGTSYRVLWRDPDGKQRSMSFKTRKEAQRFEKGLEADLDRGKYQDPQTGSETFAEWSERVMAGLVIKPKTRASYESLLRVHILPVFGEKRLRSIKRVDVQEFVTNLPVSAARANQAHAVLARILNEAVKNDLLTKNPATGVTCPRIKKKEVTPLTPGQLRNLATECGHYELFVLWLGVMGTRFAEATALTYEQFQNGVVLIDRSDDGGDGTTKDHAKRRLPVPAVLRDQIGRGEGRVFISPRGATIHNSNFTNRVFKPACERLGIDVTPHDLRHTCASILINQGASIKLVQRWLGHASPVMTLEVYGHLFPNDLEGISAKMNELFVD